MVSIVRGKHIAESELKIFESAQDSSDRHEGWRYFIEKTGQKPGVDPTEATLQRQHELELRESTAMRELKMVFPPESD